MATTTTHEHFASGFSEGVNIHYFQAVSFASRFLTIVLVLINEGAVLSTATGKVLKYSSAMV